MKKNSIQTDRRKNKKSKEWPVVIYLWMMGLGIAGYLTGEFYFRSKPHPFHWLLLLSGIILGILVGWLWYRWRGDIKL